MSRKISEVIAHIRAVAANPSVSTTMIQTEDLEMLCDAAEAVLALPGACIACGNPSPGSDHNCPAKI